MAVGEEKDFLLMEFEPAFQRRHTAADRRVIFVVQPQLVAAGEHLTRQLLFVGGLVRDFLSLCDTEYRNPLEILFSKSRAPPSPEWQRQEFCCRSPSEPGNASQPAKDLPEVHTAA
jgi:hypothetical protein